MNLVKDILKVGLHHNVPLLQFRQILVTNYLAIFCLVSTFCMSVITFHYSYVAYALCCSIVSLLYAPIFFINRGGHFKTATGYFFFLSFSAVFFLFLLSVLDGIDTSVEFILFPLMSIYLLMYDEKQRNYIYWALFALLSVIKVFEIEYYQQDYDMDFTIQLFNNLFIAWLMYSFFNFFKKLLFRAVEKTIEHERTLYSLLDNVPVYMALVDKYEVYKIANTPYAKQFGMKRNDIIGKDRSKVLPLNIYEQHRPHFQKALHGQIAPFLEENRMPNGDIVHVRGKYVPVFDDGNNIESVSIYVDDVSELIDIEQSLKQANKTKDKLFSIVAHDIRSPLNLFQSIISVTQEQVITKEDFFKYQGELSHRLHFLRKQLDKLLDWARMQMGGINAYPSKVSVNQVIVENVDLFRPLIDQKQIYLQTEMKSEYYGWIDENHLRIVMRNLIHNSIKYTNAKGKIELKTKENEDVILVELADKGRGISKEMLNSIMKKELQKSVAGTMGETGTGLGLSLSMGLLEKNNCTISLESKLGEGTTFKIWIPKAKKLHH